jgi:hypothetical protein
VPSFVRTYGAVVLIILLTAALTVWSFVWLRSVSPHGPGAVPVEPTPPVAAPIETIPLLPAPSFSTAAPAPRPVSSPPRTRRPSPRPTSSSRPPVLISAVYATGASWDTGFIGSVQVHNAGATPLTWTVIIRYARASGVRVGQAWNATVSRQGDAAVFRGPGPLAAGGTVTFGFETTKRTPRPVRPVSCSVNGVACGMS